MVCFNSIALPKDAEPGSLATQLFESLRQGLDTFELDALQDLDHVVANSLSLVRSTINNHRPVHQLPAEILGIIFRFALPSDDGGFRTSGSTESDMREERRERIAISQVCRRWRAVAFDMAAFWTVIDGSSAAWAKQCFERSGSMPLHVFLRYPLDGTTETPLAAQGARIHDLFIEFPRECRAIIPTEIPAFLPAVPNLVCLAIATRSKSFEEGRPMVDLTQCAPLFPEPPPRLRMLILKNQCWFPAVPYEQLTHLHIAQGTPVDLRALVGLLRRCSALEKLVLADVYLANARQVPDDVTAALPALRLLTLRINQSRLSMRRMLKCLVLPPSVTVRISGSEAPRALCDLQPFPALPFTADFDALSLDRTPAGLVVQAASARTGAGLLLEFGHGYTGLLVSLSKNVLPAMLPLARISRVTVRADRCDLAMQLLPALPAVTSVRLVDAAPPNVDAGVSLSAALLEFSTCFPALAALEIWSPRRTLSCLPKLPFTALKLKKFAFLNIAGAEAPLEPPPGKEYLEDWIKDVEFLTVEATDAQDLVDLPGVRPIDHAYDW